MKKYYCCALIAIIVLSLLGIGAVCQGQRLDVTDSQIYMRVGEHWVIPVWDSISIWRNSIIAGVNGDWEYYLRWERVAHLPDRGLRLSSSDPDTTDDPADIIWEVVRYSGRGRPDTLWKSTDDLLPAMRMYFDLGKCDGSEYICSIKPYRKETYTPLTQKSVCDTVWRTYIHYGDYDFIFNDRKYIPAETWCGTKPDSIIPFCVTCKNEWKRVSIYDDDALLYFTEDEFKQPYRGNGVSIYRTGVTVCDTVRIEGQ